MSDNPEKRLCRFHLLRASCAPGTAVSSMCRVPLRSMSTAFRARLPDMMETCRGQHMDRRQQTDRGHCQQVPVWLADESWLDCALILMNCQTRAKSAVNGALLCLKKDYSVIINRLYVHNHRSHRWCRIIGLLRCSDLHQDKLRGLLTCLSDCWIVLLLYLDMISVM